MILSRSTALRISSCITGTPDSWATRPVPARSSAITLRISPTTRPRLSFETTPGSSDRTTRASWPSSDSSLPRMMSFVMTF